MRAAGVTAAGAVLASCNLSLRAPGVEPTAEPTVTPTGISHPAVSTSVFAKPTVLAPVATKSVPVVDMRPIIKNIGLQVRTQTGSAPCASHAFTFLLEYQYIRRVFSDLSETFLQYATFQIEKPVMKGGENFWALNIGYQKWGVVPQNLVPNQDQAPATIPMNVLNAGKNGLRLSQSFLKTWDSSSGATPAQLDQATAFLDQDVPVAIGVLWPKNYQTQKIDGIDAMIVPTAANKWDVVSDGHAVALVGYGTGSHFPGNGYFIFRNSWGISFGDQGYGYMPFDYVLKYANDLCVFTYP